MQAKKTAHLLVCHRREIESAKGESSVNDLRLTLQNNGVVGPMIGVIGL